MFKKFLKHKQDKKKLKTKKAKLKILNIKKIAVDPPVEAKPNLDHKNYGAWYLHPSKWEKRFQNLSDPKSIDIVKSRIMLKKEKQNKVIRMPIQEKVKHRKIVTSMAFNSPQIAQCSSMHR